MTFREALKVGTYILEQGKIANADGEAWDLLEHVCGINRTFFLMHQEDALTEEQKTQYRIVLTKRIEHIPLQYILGQACFMGLMFKVNSSVLIPRFDTEVLVERVLKHVQPGMKVLDMCTGSGCIAISVKHLRPEADVTAVDISRSALLLAKENGRDNDTKIEWVQSNLFEKVKGRFHAIVSNPPYIPTAVIETLDDEVKVYEPMEALDGMEDGLFFYREIIEKAGEHLERNGMLFFEIGAEQGEDVSTLMRDAGFRDVVVEKDLAGLDRVVYGVYAGES
jgi:release factor glutamine methyltransferase